MPTKMPSDVAQINLPFEAHASKIVLHVLKGEKVDGLAPFGG
jgi:hypothetical protein